MAAVPVVGVPGLAAGVPLVLRPLAPPLPFPGDPGTITSWLIDQSLSVTSSSLVNEIEAGFARLSHDIPADPADPEYGGPMRELVDEILNSDDLCCYLTASKTGATATRIVLVHPVGKYSAGFGALSAFQGTTMLAFIGETIGDDLPTLVQARTGAVHGRTLSSAFQLRQMAVPTEAEITNYYAPGTAGKLLSPITLTAANTVQLTRLCPVPHA
jgi:hypothetical protein